MNATKKDQVIMKVKAPNSGVVPANEINNVLVTIQERITKMEAIYVEAIVELEDQMAIYRGEGKERNNRITDILLGIIKGYETEADV